MLLIELSLQLLLLEIDMENHVNQDADWKWYESEFKFSRKKYAEKIASKGNAFLMTYNDPDPWVMDAFNEFLSAESLKFIANFFDEKTDANSSFSFLSGLDASFKKLEQTVDESSGSGNVMKKRMNALEASRILLLASHIVGWNDENGALSFLDENERNARIESGPYFEFHSLMKIEKSLIW